MTNKPDRGIYSPWKEVRLDEMRGNITRRFVHSDVLMLAQVVFKAGDVVPAHRHDNEQITTVISGALHFKLGDNQDQVLIVRADEVLIIPANVLHSAVALEDTLEFDVFNPPRADWIAGTDSYLQR